MLSRLVDYFYEKPGRLRAVGKVIALAGAGLLFAAAWGNVVTGSLNILPSLGTHPAISQTLADIYPTLPLWWIPESGWGLFAAVVIVAIGLFANARGRWIDRLHRLH